MTTFAEVLAGMTGDPAPASVEQRFATEFRQADSDEPGLVLGDDGAVYLVAANGSRTQVGSGGSQPVTCVLVANGIDVKGVGQHPALWSALQDNPWDANTIFAIPDGLGLTFVFDGTDATITATEAGTWAFTLLGDASLPAGDAWRATLADSMLALTTMPGSWGSGAEATQTGVYKLPAGAVLVPRIETWVEGDAAVLALFSLAIVRLT